MTENTTDKPVWKRWHKITIGTLAAFTVLIFLIAALSPQPEETDTKTASAKATATPAPKRTFKEYLKDQGVDDLKSATCDSQRTCSIVITSNAGDKNGLIWATKDAQKASWEKKPKPRQVLVEVEGDIVSVGGKERRGIVIGVFCDREAADQIEWDNVLPEGVETLCAVSPRVDLS